MQYDLGLVGSLLTRKRAMGSVSKGCGCVLIATLLVLALFATTECKRGGSRRGGTYRGSSNVWGRAKQSHTSHNYDMYGQRRTKSQSEALPDSNKKAEVAADSPKASAPPAPKPGEPLQKSSPGSSSSGFIQQEQKQAAAPLYTANTNQRPIGWDVGQNTNTGWNTGNVNPASYSNPSTRTGYQNAYPVQANAYPNTGSNNYYGTGTNYNYGNNMQPHYTPNQFSGYSPPAAVSPNGYYNNMGGYGNNGGGGGMFGNGFGGHSYGNQGFGGYGSPVGYGGWGGHGMGGYGKRFGGGFGMGFGKTAFRSAIVGLLVWNLVSGLNRRPYYVYNYYNNPEKVPPEISLPANIIVLCPANVTSLCAPNTAPLCTSNDTILCVVLAQQTIPCDQNSTLKCINSTVPCGGDDKPCSETDPKSVTSSVNIPCVTNATIMGKLENVGPNSIFDHESANGTTVLCVTTMAMPQPEEEAKRTTEEICSTGSPEQISGNGTAVICPNNTAISNSTEALTSNLTAKPLDI